MEWLKGLKTCKKKFLVTLFLVANLKWFIAISESCTIIPSLITASKTFYSRIVEDLIPKLVARIHIVTTFFSGSCSVLSMFLQFLDNFSSVFSINPNRCIIGGISPGILASFK